jgi:arylsulfatase A-like enzyme
VRLIDVAPTLLALGHIPVPADLDGHVVNVLAGSESASQVRETFA